MGFFSDNSMSPEEIDSAINKITTLYNNNIAVYGTRFLNYQEFRARYLEALKSKANMAVFFKAEIEYLHKQEAKAHQYTLLRQGTGTEGQETQGILDKTINDIIAQTEDYPEVQINNRANIEIKRLIGVCRLIHPELSNLSIYVPIEQSNLYHQSNKVIQDYVQEPYGFVFKSYLSALENDFLPATQVDAIGQKLIKEVAVALQTLLSILRSTDPVKAGHMVEYISKATRDFRLDIFKGLA